MADVSGLMNRLGALPSLREDKARRDREAMESRIKANMHILEEVSPRVVSLGNLVRRMAGLEVRTPLDGSMLSGAGSYRRGNIYFTDDGAAGNGLILCGQGGFTVSSRDGRVYNRYSRGGGGAEELMQRRAELDAFLKDLLKDYGTLESDFLSVLDRNLSDVEGKLRG